LANAGTVHQNTLLVLHIARVVLAGGCTKQGVQRKLFKQDALKFKTASMEGKGCLVVYLADDEYGAYCF